MDQSTADDLTAKIDHAKRELLRLNPGMKEAGQFVIRDGVVREWHSESPLVADISPPAVFAGIEEFGLDYAGFGARRSIEDLSALAGMTRLVHVTLEFCPNLKDFAPLLDKPLRELSLYRSRLPEDLS
ncbi:MAG: hypothetical protein O3A00_20730 [Planctomycetota bacterium]|nr:hypothetical protein [Planctomycetota bacterium]